MSDTELPSRYEPLTRLGQGGGGEVWSVRDRFTRGRYALKLLAKEAGARELAALVREAVALLVELPERQVRVRDAAVGVAAVRKDDRLAVRLPRRHQRQV